MARTHAFRRHVAGQFTELSKTHQPTMTTALKNNDFLCSCTSKHCSIVPFISSPPTSPFLVKQQAEGIHFNLINNLVDHI